MPDLTPEQAEAIGAVTSPAQMFVINTHLANGRADLALIVAQIRPEFFAGYDALMQVAWEMGMADALAAKK